RKGSTSWALAPDGRTLALGYWDHTIRLWDVASGKPAARLTGYPDRFYPAYTLAFAPDGQALAAAGSYHGVCVLDVATDKQRCRPSAAHESNIRQVALSPDGRLLATASHDRTVILWETAGGRALRELRGHESWVYAVAFAPDGRTVASGGSDGMVYLWDTATGKQLRQLDVDGEKRVLGMAEVRVGHLAFSPDRKVLAVGLGQSGGPVLRLRNGGTGIRLYEVATG